MNKNWKAVLLTSLILTMFSISSLFAQDQDWKKWAEKPAMGWNSYNCYGSTVQEKEMKANADFVAKHLKSYGYEYVVVDFQWYYPHELTSKGTVFSQTVDPIDGSYSPNLCMDEYGRLMPYVEKFPSSVDGAGFKPLGDYIHSLGLKFGLHIMRGIPQEAVYKKTPILGAPGIDASMIADTNSVCTWLDNMYGIDMDKEGAQEYYNSLFELYADWGVDFIKVDDIARPYAAKEVEAIRKAIDRTGRKIVLSLSPGKTPLSQGPHVMQHANMWRMSDDFWDRWDLMFAQFELCSDWAQYNAPGTFPDADMLQIGRLALRGPVGSERDSRLTEDEKITHLTLWSIARSPLFMGGELTMSDADTIKLLTNPEVIAVNQNGSQPRQIYRDKKMIIWKSKAEDEESDYIAIFNITKFKKKFSIPLEMLGFQGKVALRNLWTHTDLPIVEDKLDIQINSHGAYLFKVKSAN